MPTLFMVELAVPDPAASAGWYAALGLQLTLADPATGFRLLESPGGGRLALRAGPPVPGGVCIHFEVPDLDAELARLAALGIPPHGPPKSSPEGYRRAALRDPDGYAVVVFAWAGGTSG